MKKPTAADYKSALIAYREAKHAFYADQNAENFSRYAALGYQASAIGKTLSRKDRERILAWYSVN